MTLQRGDYKAVDSNDREYGIKIILNAQTAKDQIVIDGGGYIETYNTKRDRLMYYDSWDKAVKSFELRVKKYNCTIIKF